MTPSEPLPPTTPPGGRLLSGLNLQRLPWWALLMTLGGLAALYGIVNSPIYIETWQFLAEGVLITIELTVTSYLVALVLGLLAALAQISRRAIPFTIARIYIEIIRGVPLLVLLIYIAFVITPGLADLTRQQWLRNDIVRATLGLGIAYGAFLAEVYRAGIESIGRGQSEASRSLGMTQWQSMRFVILPQAIRVILPPLGNEFIAMLKDSSLASVLSVTELTYSGSLLNARTFRSFETYNMVALLYLTMTMIGSVAVRLLERWSGKAHRR